MKMILLLPVAKQQVKPLTELRLDEQTVGDWWGIFDGFQEITL